MAEEALYPYHPEFQTKILAACITNPAFLRMYRSVIRVEYFSLDEHKLLARRLLEFYDHPDNSRGLIGLDTVVASTIRSIPDPGQRTAVLTLGEDIRQADLHDFGAMTEEVVTFAKHAEARREIRNAAEALAKGQDIEVIVERLQQTFQIGKNLLTESVALPRDVLDIVDKWRLRRENLVPTGFKSVDQCLGGGIGPGELGIIAGLPKSFKSGSLANLAVGAVRNPVARNVIYFTLELSEIQVAFRIAKRVSLQTDKDCLTNASKFKRTLGRAWSQQIAGNIYLKEYPIRTADARDFEAHMSFLTANGARPDLVIVDYGSIMKDSGDDKIVSARNKFSSLRALAQRWKIPVWTAHRLNRESYNQVQTSGANVAESIEIAADCDFMLALEQTREENDAHIMRGRVLFSRNEEQHVQIKFAQDKPKMALRDLGFAKDAPTSEKPGKHGKKGGGSDLPVSLDEVPADLFDDPAADKHDSAEKAAAAKWKEGSV